MKQRNRLRVRRAELVMNQMDVIAKVKVDGKAMSRDRFWKIESGYVEPTDAEQKALARALKTTVEDIFPDQVPA